MLVLIARVILARYPRRIAEESSHVPMTAGRCDFQRLQVADRRNPISFWNSQRICLPVAEDYCARQESTYAMLYGILATRVAPRRRSSSGCSEHALCVEFTRLPFTAALKQVTRRNFHMYAARKNRLAIWVSVSLLMASTSDVLDVLFSWHPRKSTLLLPPSSLAACVSLRIRSSLLREENRLANPKTKPDNFS